MSRIIKQLQEQKVGKFLEKSGVNRKDTSDIEKYLGSDWSKIGNYRKGTPEDTTGFSLFLEICDKKLDLNLTPAFFPTSNEHNYEWDFVIDNNKWYIYS